MYRVATAAALCLLALPAMAEGPRRAQAGDLSPREERLGLFQDVTVADRREVVRTQKIYDPWEAEMLRQDYVNQYVFENDAEKIARETSGARYR